MSQKIPIPEKSELVSRYDNQSISGLARLYNTSNPTIRKWLKTHDIPIKTHLESSRQTNKKTLQGFHDHPQLNNYEWLYEQRITNKLSYENIGLLIGVSSFCVKKYCKKYDIPAVQYNNSDFQIQQFLKNKKYLETEYDSGKTLEEIAGSIGSNKATLSEWFKKHSIETRPSNWYERHYNKVSDECNEIVQFINTFDVEYVLNDRKTLNGKEIDILIFSHKLAIEYNGLYHHIYRPTEKLDSLKKGRYYHLDKTEKCNEQGIQLLHIFSDDWKTKKDIWKSIIRNHLGYSQKIHARKCMIKPVSKPEKTLFLEQNHLQGNDTSTIQYGLFHDDELVSLFTARKNRYNHKYDWEIMRFCNKLNHTVVGGFSKLLKHFHKNHSGSIITYANREYSNGELYRNNGFKLLNVNKPSFYHVDLNKEKKYHRTTFQKKRLLPDSTMSESDIMTRLGYHRIWNCGTLTFTY